VDHCRGRITKDFADDGVMWIVKRPGHDVGGFKKYAFSVE
jgi:hypothetical protein